MTFTFDNNNTFRNVGIHNGNNELIVMNINASSDNISLHSSSNSSNVDTLSIKSILNKDTNKDLNLSAYDGTSINPIIQINNTHQHVNITSNLNVGSNLNITSNLNVIENINVKNINVKNINVTNNLNVNNLIGNSFAVIPTGNLEAKYSNNLIFQTKYSTDFFRPQPPTQDYQSNLFIGNAWAPNYGGTVQNWSDYQREVDISKIILGGCGGTDRVCTISNRLLGAGTTTGTTSNPSLVFSSGGWDGVSNLYNTHMVIREDGKIGISTNSPTEKLEVNGNISTNGSLTSSKTLIKDMNDSHGAIGSQLMMTQIPEGYAKYYALGYQNNDASNSTTYLNCSGGGNIHFTNNGHTKAIITNQGHVGINVTTPANVTFPLFVDKTVSFTSHPFTVNSTYSYTRYIFGGWGTHITSATAIGHTYSACFKGYIIIENGIYVSSDSRIKTNIIDVPDTLALSQLRSIPCRYYEYIDKLSNGNSKDIGFIAQEVKSVLPMAVGTRKEFIPDIYKLIECNWININDNTFKMNSPELVNVNNIKYKFFVSNNDNNDDEEEIIVIGNNDDTFTFDNKYDNVFCYGKEVDDFNTLDKNKLFCLNFSATQEIDKIQQKHNTRIVNLENENSTLKAENELLKTQVSELTNIINKLKTATSFEEFKQSL